MPAAGNVVVEQRPDLCHALADYPTPDYRPSVSPPGNKTTSPDSHQQINSSFTGPVLRRLFRSPCSSAADNHKSDHCDKKDSQFQLVHHAYSPSPGMGWHQVLRSNTVSLAILQ